MTKTEKAVLTTVSWEEQGDYELGIDPDGQWTRLQRLRGREWPCWCVGAPANEKSICLDDYEALLQRHSKFLLILALRCEFDPVVRVARRLRRSRAA